MLLYLVLDRIWFMAFFLKYPLDDDLEHKKCHFITVERFFMHTLDVSIAHLDDFVKFLIDNMLSTLHRGDCWGQRCVIVSGI